jgi:hypothetical protein
MLMRIPVIAGFLAMTAAPVLAQQAVNLPTRDKALAEKPAVVFTYGKEEGASHELLAGVRAVAFDKADNLFVLDQQNTRVLVLDARGKYLRQFGKKGGGPGEFQAPLGLAILSDGNIAVSDLGNRAFVIFKPSGEYVRNIPYNDEIGMPTSVYADPRGGLVLRTMPRLRPGESPGEGENVSLIARQPFNAITANTADNGKVTTSLKPVTLFKVPVAPPKVQDAGAASDGGRRTMAIRMDPIFGARASFGVLPDGSIALHHETNYAIKVIDGAGRHVRTIARPFTAKKVTKKDQEEWQERRKRDEASGALSGAQVTIAMTNVNGATSTAIGAGAAGRGAVGGAPMQMKLEDMPFAEYMSVVTNVRTDPQGRIWIQRRAPDGSDRGPIDIVTAAGQYIGTIAAQQLPDAVSQSGLAAYITRDDMGVEQVKVTRLPGTWEL